MQAFLLAAGLGTRLRPLTNDRPKALVEVGGRTLLEINLQRLIEAGATRVVVNVHHFAEKMSDFIAAKHWDAEVLVSDERAMLMDTGGGLKQAERLFRSDEPIVVHNVDVLHRLELRKIVEQHVDSKQIAPLCVSQRRSSRYLLSDAERHLVGLTNVTTGETLWSGSPKEDYISLAFSGIAVLQPELLALLPEANASYSIIPQYLNIAKEHAINLFEHAPTDWMDVGKPDTLPLAEQFL